MLIGIHYNVKTHNRMYGCETWAMVKEIRRIEAFTM